MITEKPIISLGEGDFEVFVQPKYDVKTEKVIGVEALSRFVKEDGEVLLPFRYIEELGENGELVKLDFYMFEKICKMVSEWEKLFGETVQVLPISVNFDKITLESQGFLEKFFNIANSYGVNPDNIEVEITELNSFKNYKLAHNVINILRENKYKVSIDDYGKNSSAFTIIRQIDVDTIKIDRDIIVESEYNKKAFMILEAVTKLAGKFGMSVVAEGVETSGQLDIVRKVGCNAVQGWYFSKAMSKECFKEYMLGIG